MKEMEVALSQFEQLLKEQLLRIGNMTTDKVDFTAKETVTVGIIDGAPADLDVIKEYASIPSRDGLLTMLAGGMIQYVKDLAIGLNMYAEQLEK